MSWEIITFDFIYDCWRTKTYPDNFNDLLEDYLKTKNKIFLNATIPGNSITSWLNKILVSIEIGMMRDQKRFLPYKQLWLETLGRTYEVSLEDKWVTWV